MFGNRETSATAEITVRAIALGRLLPVATGAVKVRVELKAEMTVTFSIPAAVLAMAIFKLLFRHSTILEANQVQTCASADVSLAAGIRIVVTFA